MTAESISLGEVIVRGNSTVLPSKVSDEQFDLYSIPAYDRGAPEVVLGGEIGSSKQVVRPGDVLLSKIVPHIKRAWVVGPGRGRRMIASSEWIVFRSNRIEPGYLRHVLMSDPFHVRFMQTVAGVGGSLLRARPAHVAKLSLPLPDPEEQRRIAQVLDRVDAIRSKRHDTLGQLSEFGQSVFLKIFGDPARNPYRWPIVRIADLIESATYGTSDKAGHTGEFPILRMNNITRTGRIDISDLKYIDIPSKSLERYTVRRGDVLFNRTNSPELVGKTAIYRNDEPFVYAGYLIRLRTNDTAHPEYLSAFLNSRYAKLTLRNMCKSIVGMANINARELQGMKIMCPPQGLQQEFARCVLAVERSKERQQAHLAELDALFGSLQQRAFRGEL